MLCEVCNSLDFKPFRLLSPEHQQFISGSISEESGREEEHNGFFFHHQDVSTLRQAVQASQCELCLILLSIVGEAKVPGNSASEEDEDGDDQDGSDDEGKDDDGDQDGSDDGDEEVTLAPSEEANAGPIWFVSQSLPDDGSWTPEPEKPIRVARGKVMYGQALWTLDIPDEVSDCTDVSISKTVESESDNRILERDIKLAKWWMTRCKAHEHCRQMDSHPIWPTRLIHVEPAEPRLVQVKWPGGNTAYLPASRGYATLSHCWGKEPLITTTKATLSDRESGIPMSSLPKTFRDAVTVCRGLDIPYLWIDALCIIQDSKEDWANEASNMGTVYKEAAVCISAVGSSDGNGGLFFPETKPGLPQGLLHTLCRTNLTFPRIRAEDGRIHTDRPVYIGLRHGVTVSGPLRTRAWVLQEEKLSRRQLEFTASGLHWTCQSVHAHAANIFGSAFGRNEFWDQFDVAVNEDGGFADLFLRDEERELYDYWYRSIVEEYTGRGITYWSDRVIALAALTGHFDKALWLGLFDGRELTIKRLAGLWSTDLPRGLLWTPVDDDAVRVKPPAVPYLGPSWSWMSVRGAVSYREALRSPPGESCVEVVDADCAALDGTDYTPTGFVAGQLTLKGKLRGFTYWRRCWTVDIPGVGLVRFKEDRDLAVDEDETVLGVVAMDDLRDLPEDYKLFAVPLVRRPATEEEEESCFCLVVKPAIDGGFLRVGHMTLTKLDFFDDVKVSTITIY